MTNINRNYRILAILIAGMMLISVFAGVVGTKDISPFSSNITFWTEGSSVKIRPFDSPSGEQSIHIKAAKNEYEAFQVAVTAPEGLTGVNVLVSNLTGDGGTITSENIRLYQEGYMNVVTPSNIFDGEAGLWPDALIPATDVFFNETRDGFPFDVPAGENRAIWVDVFVPANANAGTYTGNLTITAFDKNPVSIPVTLTVWDFTLPSTSSLISAFGFDGWELLVGHYGTHEPYDQIVPLSKLYAESGLMHRISLDSVTEEDWSIYPWPQTAPINWTEFDANWGPFLDGVDLPYGLKGARLTSISLNTWGDTEEERIAYWQQYANHFKDKGWFERLFDYTWDEPHDAPDFAALKHRATLIKQADPDLRVLVTTNIQDGMKYDLLDIIDIWVPVINEMHGKPVEICWDPAFAGNQRDDYDERLAAGDELWWYQSCMSHGCYTSDDECESGWPSYMIDIPAMYNRIMGWQSFKYNISGELYFSTNYAYEFNDNGSNDPWNTLYYFGGNGDGTLFYPGRPDKIGGTHHIPIESIRLKMIREGMEDYEYMKMLQDIGDESFAMSQVDSVVTNTYTFSHDPAVLYTARENMAVRILAQNKIPIASFTYSPAHPVVNQTIIFDASNSTDQDGVIVSYEWDFGDGTNGNALIVNPGHALGEVVTHSYSSAGDYTVNLTVTDDDGAMNSTTKMVNVTEAKPAISISTDKFDYSLGDTMTTTISFKNPTPDSVDTHFIWYFGLPEYGYWKQILVMPLTLPAGFDESYDIPIDIGNWGAVGFNATWYVALLNTTLPYGIISHDTADWRYVPTAASTAEQEITPEEIATEITKNVERVELPIQYL